jgi:hypothetical protein
MRTPETESYAVAQARPACERTTDRLGWCRRRASATKTVAPYRVRAAESITVIFDETEVDSD